MKIKNIKAIAFLQNLEKAYTEGVYADTPANRKLGRVGMSYKEWTQKQQGGKQQQQSEKEKNIEKKEEVNYEDGYAVLDISKDKLSPEDKENLAKVQSFIKKKCDELDDEGFINVAKDSGGICIKMNSEGKISVDATGQVNWGRVADDESGDYSGYAASIEDSANEFAEEINKTIKPKKKKVSKTAGFEKEIVDFAQEIGAKKKEDFGGIYYEMETNHNGDNIKYKIRLNSDRKGPKGIQNKGALGMVIERFGPSGYNWVDCGEMTGLPFEEQVSYYKDALKALTKGNENILNKTKSQDGDYYDSIKLDLNKLKESKSNNKQLNSTKEDNKNPFKQ